MKSTAKSKRTGQSNKCTPLDPHASEFVPGELTNSGQSKQAFSKALDSNPDAENNEAVETQQNDMSSTSPADFSNEGSQIDQTKEISSEHVEGNNKQPSVAVSSSKSSSRKNKRRKSGKKIQEEQSNKSENFRNSGKQDDLPSASKPCSGKKNLQSNQLQEVADNNWKKQNQKSKSHTKQDIDNHERESCKNPSDSMKNQAYQHKPEGFVDSLQKPKEEKPTNTQDTSRETGQNRGAIPKKKNYDNQGVEKVLSSHVTDENPSSTIQKPASADLIHENLECSPPDTWETYQDDFAPKGNNRNELDIKGNPAQLPILVDKHNDVPLSNEPHDDLWPGTDDWKLKKDKNKKSKKTEIQKFRDPRMDREKLNESNNLSMYQEESDNVSSKRSEGNYKQTKITSWRSRSNNKENLDKDFEIWEKHRGGIKHFKKVIEIESDLFEQPKDYSLAHCVAEDLRMGSGIAVIFKREFKCLPDLLDQRARQGGVAILPDKTNGRFIYYLVTKKESTGKPTYYSLWKSLYNMRDHIKENKVTKLAIPRLGCGLDRLEWDKVKSMLEQLFEDIDIEIKVCNFQKTEPIEDKKSKCRLVIEDIPITQIEPGTLILYLATSNKKEDDVTRLLSKKFNFWRNFLDHKNKNLGDVVYYEDRPQNFGLCGCIVRATSQDPINFKYLQKCIQNVNQTNRAFKNEAYQYVGFQWVDEKAYSEDGVNQKIITMFINCLKNVDVYICRGNVKGKGV